MRIAMVGTGYVGLVSGACFADFGHHVVCIDKDMSKLSALKRDEIPIYEPGLNDLGTGKRRAAEDDTEKAIPRYFFKIRTYSLFRVFSKRISSSKGTRCQVGVGVSSSRRFRKNRGAPGPSHSAISARPRHLSAPPRPNACAPTGKGVKRAFVA